MTAIFMKPEDERRNYSWKMADESGADAFEKRWASKKREFKWVREPLESIRLDAGGAVSLKELKIDFEANGVKFNIYARQIPYFLAFLKGAKEHPKVPGHIGFTGFNHTYILSLATVDAMVRVMTDLEIQYGHEIREAEEKLTAGLQKAGVLALGKCSCQSGKPYVQCCRKVEKTS